jgi:hypothetical protein
MAPPVASTVSVVAANDTIEWKSKCQEFIQEADDHVRYRKRTERRYGKPGRSERRVAQGVGKVNAGYDRYDFTDGSVTRDTRKRSRTGYTVDDQRSDCMYPIGTFE